MGVLLQEPVTNKVHRNLSSIAKINLILILIMCCCCSTSSTSSPVLFSVCNLVRELMICKHSCRWTLENEVQLHFAVFKQNFTRIINRKCFLTTKKLFSSWVRSFQIPFLKPLNAGPVTSSWSYKTLPQDFIVKNAILFCCSLFVLIWLILSDFWLREMSDTA